MSQVKSAAMNVSDDNGAGDAMVVRLLENAIIIAGSGGDHK